MCARARACVYVCVCVCVCVCGGGCSEHPIIFLSGRQPATPIYADARYILMPSLFQRPISVFQLHEPLVIGDYRINAIEIPCPKPGKRHPHGLEHAEFVIKSGALAEFVAEHSAITFDRKAMNKAVNPDVSEQWCGVLCLAAVSVCACLCVCVRTCVFARVCVCSSCCLLLRYFGDF